jgi:hypothetical protein
MNGHSHLPWTIAKTVPLAQWPVWCIAGFVSVMLEFPAAAKMIPRDLGIAVSVAVSTPGIVSLIATKVVENEQWASERKPWTNTLGAERLGAMDPEKRDGQISELNPEREESTWVAIIGGLALFFWIQRFRNFSV